MGQSVETYKVTVQELGSADFLVEQVVRFERAANNDGAVPRWVVERRGVRWRKGQSEPDHSWIDSRLCPGVNVLLGQIDTLPAVTFSGPRRLPEPLYIPPSHSPSVKLDIIPARLGESRVSVSFEAREGPLVRWWFDGRNALDACWRSEPPQVDGKPVDSMLKPIDVGGG